MPKVTKTQIAVLALLEQTDTVSSFAPKERAALSKLMGYIEPLRVFHEGVRSDMSAPSSNHQKAIDGVFALTDPRNVAFITSLLRTALMWTKNPTGSSDRSAWLYAARTGKLKSNAQAHGVADQQDKFMESAAFGFGRHGVPSVVDGLRANVDAALRAKTRKKSGRKRRV